MDKKAVTDAELNIFDIERFATQDGPGIRTVVFLKGCPLCCGWCANPESQFAGRSLRYQEQKCLHCGHCVSSCPYGAISIMKERPVWNRSLCRQCGKCEESCPGGAIFLQGTGKSVSEILHLVVKDKAYYLQSGGGATLSGGEPLLQPEGVRQLLTGCKEQGISTAIETTCNVPRKVLESLLEVTDYFLCDIKHMNGKKLADFTGGNRDLIMQNLCFLSNKCPEKLILRTPVIPGFNDTLLEISDIFQFLKTINNRKLQLLPFHNLGGHKYKELDKPNAYEQVKMLADAALEEYVMLGRSMGIQVVVGNH